MAAHTSLPCTLEAYSFKAVYKHQVTDLNKTVVSLISKYYYPRLTSINCWPEASAVNVKREKQFSKIRLPPYITIHGPSLFLCSNAFCSVVLNVPNKISPCKYYILLSWCLWAICFNYFKIITPAPHLFLKGLIL